jgi:zinc protease
MSAFQFMESSGGIEAYRLKKNDLQVLLYPDSTAPVVTMMVTYRVGSRNEVPGNTGATHFLEHIMFKGTDRFNKQKGTSVFNVLQRVGAMVNATTWLDRTNYYELLPKEHLGLALEIEADRMRHARIADDDVASEKTVILNEFDRGDNEALRNLYQTVWSTAFMAHPYHHSTIGWRSDIEQTTPEKLRHFYNTYYYPNNATVSVIGDIDKDAVLAQIETFFGAMETAPHELPDVTIREPEQKGERRVTVKQSGQLGAVMVAYKTPAGLHPDNDALDMLSMILSSGKNSYLYKALTDQSLTTYVSASNSRHRDPGLFYFYGMLSPKVTHTKVEKKMFATVKEIQKKGITQADLDKACRQMRASHAFDRDGSYSIASELNEAIAIGDWKFYTEYLDRIAKVTPEDVQRVAKQYLVEDSRTIGWYVPTS